MNVPKKRVEIVKLYMVKERGIQYLGRYVKSPQDAVALVNEHLKMDRLERESFVVMALNAKNEPTHLEIISTGSLTASIVHPREVFKMAILANAHGIVCVHNHPSGNPQPSEEDRKITKRLKEASELLGIPLLDHIIIGELNKSYSFKEEEGIL